jgi:outer membrane murein-binding lipoprotein Lpp
MKKTKIIKTIFCFVICTLVLAAGASAQAKKETPRTVTEVLSNTVKNLEHDLVPAAEAMPEDKFSFTPSNGEFKGVRTFAEQIKHIAAVNYELGAAILSEKPPVDIGDESGPASVTSKADILKYLNDSFLYVHKAIDTINEKNLTGTVKSPFGEYKVTRLGLATTVAWHGFDHYGQVVEYLRMNGIVPPASRPGN